MPNLALLAELESTDTHENKLGSEGSCSWFDDEFPVFNSLLRIQNRSNMSVRSDTSSDESLRLRVERIEKDFLSQILDFRAADKQFGKFHNLIDHIFASPEGIAP